MNDLEHRLRTTWYLVITVYPDPRSSYHLVEPTTALDAVPRSLCAKTKQLNIDKKRRGLPDEPQHWMCRRCIVEAARRAAA